jgi:hypothetical protein
MPKRFGKRTQQLRKTSSAERGDRQGSAAGTADRNIPDTESEFSVPQKWQENEQENVTASSGPDSAARDGERSEEAADTRAS